MKVIILIISYLLTSVSFSQNKAKSEIIGQITNKEIIITGDTLQLKNNILQHFKNDSLGLPNFTVQIIQSKTFGEVIEDYYFVLLQDKNRKINVAKWLEKEGNDLILISKFENDNYWQVLLTACIGEGDCFPQLAVVNSEKTWACGQALVCSADSKCTKTSTLQLE